MTSEKSRESVYGMFRITHVVYLRLYNLFRIANCYFLLLLKISKCIWYLIKSCIYYTYTIMKINMLK